MSALKINDTLDNIQSTMEGIAPHRRSELFQEFLIKGYTAVTLDTVPADKVSDLLRAKLCLGTLITLYDDFADRPSQANAQLLEILYQLNFERDSSALSIDAQDRHVLYFAKSLFAQIKEVLESLPNYHRLKDVIHFDLAQFYTANQYSSLLTAHRELNNELEKSLYTHHNMGMVMVAMMDVMSMEKLNDSELGAMRAVFLLGQRMGRIFNVLSTHQRESLDGDITGELSTFKTEAELQRAKQKLRQELRVLSRKILSYETQIESFSVRSYLSGLLQVQRLHEKMEGVI